MTSYKQGSLIDVKKNELVRAFGPPNNVDDPDKVVNSWVVKFGNMEIHVWDYKGSHTYDTWSVYYHNDEGKKFLKILFDDRFVDMYP